MRLAITRAVSGSIAECELTFLERQPIDVGRARQQHGQYESLLKGLGLGVLSLPEEPGLPDSVFVEDTALVLDECAIILRPGAPSRRAETETIAHVLSPFRELHYIQAPAHVDGGDILRLGRDLYIGITRRSDTNAMEQIQDLVQPLGCKVHAVRVTGCLHLKSAVTQAAENTLLINPRWVDAGAFRGVKIIDVDPSEPHGANTLYVGATTVCAAAFPRTRQRLIDAGITTAVVEVDELAKAEGALTCCSLIFRI